MNHNLYEEGTPTNEGPTLDECNRNIIRIAYIIGIVLWSVIVYYFRIGFDNPISILIVIIPYFIFILAAFFITTDNVYCDLRENGFFAIGLVAILPLVSWYSQYYTKDKKRFITMAITAVFISMLALFEFCLPRQFVCLLEHVRSILQTMGIVLLIYVMSEFLASLASGQNTGVLPSASVTAGMTALAGTTGGGH